MDFIDRNKIRQDISQILKDIQNGVAHCIWIEGESGTGKSWLTKYIIENNDMDYLQYDKSEIIYKCRENSTGIEYTWVSSLLSFFQEEYPEQFNQYCVKHFSEIYVSSFSETLAKIIPSINGMGWTKEAINAHLDRIEASKDDIEGRLYATSLKNFFSDLIIYFFTKIENRTSLIICIDDAAWMDELSIDVLNSLLKKNKCINETLKISIILTTRNLTSLNPENNNYKLLEGVLRDCFEENLNYFKIKNFNYAETCEYLESRDVQHIEINVKRIFDFTQGNPYGLFQVLKFKDEDFDEILSYSNTDIKRYHDNTASAVSLDRIIVLNDSNEYIILILACLSAIGGAVDSVTLAQATRNLVHKVLSTNYHHARFTDCLELLVSEDLIMSENLEYSLKHDSIKEGLFTYLKECGEFNMYMECIASTLNNPECVRYEGELFALLDMYAPEQCFYSYVKRIDAKQFNSRYLGIIADSVEKTLSVYTVTNIEAYIIPHILKECVHKNYYDSAYRICKNIYPLTDKLNPKCRITYLTDYTRILIDMGKINQTDETPSAVELSQRLLDEVVEKDDVVMAHLVNMSAYEHILDFKKILSLNEEISLLIESEDVLPLTKALYYRNQGLIKAHRFLRNEYQMALDNALQVDNITDREIMLGTCNNNMGLCFLYNGKVDLAEKYFEQSKKHLHSCGYNDFRAINNLGVCALLNNDIYEAYNYFIEADSRNQSCIFEKLCIKSNIAIVEWKLGHEQEACKILHSIIEEHKTHSLQTNDELVYSSAYVNMGYIMFEKEEFFDSLDMYNRSMAFTYRYDNEKQNKKRVDMVNLCLHKVGNKDMPLIDIDIQDVSSNIFKKMYAPIAFAHYVI